MSLFPALLFGVALLGFFGQQALVDEAASFLVSVGAPSDTVNAVTKALEGAQESRGTALTALVLALLTSLYGASGAFGAVGRALNTIWRVDEGRGFVKHKAHDIGWTLVVLGLVLVTAVLVFLGGALSEFVFSQIGLGDTTAAVWRYARWPAALLAMILIYAVVYFAAPNVEIRRFQWITPGAAFGVVAWLLASAGVLHLRLELRLLPGHLRRVRGGRDPARLAVADEPRAAVRGGAERGHRPAALAAPLRALRRAAAAAQGAGGRLAPANVNGGWVGERGCARLSTPSDPGRTVTSPPSRALRRPAQAGASVRSSDHEHSARRPGQSAQSSRCGRSVTS